MFANLFLPCLLIRPGIDRDTMLPETLRVWSMKSNLTQPDHEAICRPCADQSAIRVVVVDIDPLMRDIFKEIPGDEIHCSAAFSDIEKALQAIPGLCPDAILINPQIFTSQDNDVIQRFKHCLPGLRCIVVAGCHDFPTVCAASRAGADAYLTKPVTRAQLKATVAFVVGKRRALNALLTRREQEVMRNLAGGLVYKEIADKMRISYSGVHKHQHRIFLKLHVKTRSEAISIWHSYSGD
jgi:DNA-binding NarL/FixJ family response regulator